LGNWDTERHDLWETVQEMVRMGLVAGSSGNASIRLSGDRYAGTVLITPTRRPYRELGPEDMVVIDLEGETVAGEHAPSSETATHLGIYSARGDVGAILHTHSIYASVAAVAGMEIPPILDEMVVKLGGPVSVAEYAFPSTEELAQRACHALDDRNAVLLRNHGVVGVGWTRWEALEVCQLVERAAQIFVYSSMLGRANPLPPDIVRIEQELFRMQRMTRPTSEV
jgi:L-fuculose-phosphate aldolase